MHIVSSGPGAFTGSPRQAKQSAPLSDLDVQLLPAASVAAILARWGILQARVVQLRSRGLTALGLVARLQPTHQAGGHAKPGAASWFHRTLAPGWPAGGRSGPAGDPKATGRRVR